MAIFSILGGGGGGGGGGSPVGAPTFYISTRGNDGSGDGTFEKPYLTFNKLNSVLFALTGQPSFTVPFVVFVENGTYNEGDNSAALYPNCCYIGYGELPTIITASSAITIYAAAITPLITNAASIVSLQNLQFGTDVNFDFFNWHSQGNVFYMDYIKCSAGNFSYTAGSADRVKQISNSVFGNIFGLQDAQIYDLGIYNCQIGTGSFSTANYDTVIMRIFSCNITDLYLTAANGLSLEVTMTSCYISDALNLLNDDLILNTDANSLPSDRTALFITNDPIINLICPSYGSEFLPTIPSNWASVTVDNVQDALDDLGGRAPFAPVLITTNTNMVPNACYIVKGSGPLTLTMPSDIRAGQFMRVIGYIGGWEIVLQGGSTIIVGEVTASTSITSGNITDAIDIYCVVNDIGFVAIPSSDSSLEIV